MHGGMYYVYKYVCAIYPVLVADVRRVVVYRTTQKQKTKQKVEEKKSVAVCGMLEHVSCNERHLYIRLVCTVEPERLGGGGIAVNQDNGQTNRQRRTIRQTDGGRTVGESLGM